MWKLECENDLLVATDDKAWTFINKSNLICTNLIS